MSEYARLDVDAGPRYVSIYVDGRGYQGSRHIVLSPLDAKQFGHRVIAEAYEVERLALKAKLEEEARIEEEARRRAEEQEEARRAEVEAQSSEAVDTEREPDATAH